MDKSDIIRDLQSLDYALAESGLRGRMLIIGSAALLLGESGFDRETRDVDIVECSDTVLKLLTTCVGDFNNAAATFGEEVPPDAVIESVDLGLTCLDVERLSDETIVAMKLRAGRPQDLDDVEMMLRSVNIDWLKATVKDPMYRAEFSNDDEYLNMLKRFSVAIGDDVEPGEWNAS